MMRRVSALGVPMCQPIEFGTCDEGVEYPCKPLAEYQEKYADNCNQIIKEN